MALLARFLAATLAWAPFPALADGALPPPGEPAWQPLRFRSVERSTDYAPLADAQPGVRAESRCGASALVLPLDGAELERTPVLHWQWRVLRGLDVADERSRGGDDFAARVYVMFRFQPERAGWLERAQRALGESLYGSRIPGSALNFVWTSRIEPGATWTSPYTEHSRLVALERGPGPGWRSEAVDVPAAYAEAFGEPPPAAEGLGLMTDADDTCQHAVAEFRGFRLAAREVGSAGAKPDGAGARTPPASAPAGAEAP